MAKAPEAPSAETNGKNEKLAVIVDQDGMFLRLERGTDPKNAVELEDGKDYVLFEETVEKEDIAEPGTPPQTNVDSANKLAPGVCPKCQGTGLKDPDTRCETCGGSGKIE